MAARVVVRVRFKKGMGWGYEVRGPGGGVLYLRTKQEAVAEAVAYVKGLALKGEKVELYIHKKSGAVQTRRTYPRSSDPKGRG